MANKITVVDLPQRNFVDGESRYLSSTMMYYGEKNFLTFETYKRSPFQSSNNDRHYVITKGTEYRPDLVARRAYGNVSLWWKIMEANRIFDIYDFKAGRNIIIPDALF